MKAAGDKGPEMMPCSPADAEGLVDKSDNNEGRDVVRALWAAPSIVVTPAPASAKGPAMPATATGVGEEVAAHAAANWMADGLDWATVVHAPTAVCST
jgi:hypothetical protein